MKTTRTYRHFAHKGANYRICCRQMQAVTDEIIRQRALLENYIQCHPAFATAMTPLKIRDDAPEIARLMSDAATLADVGPMAGVAGAIAQLAGQAGITAGANEVIVDNGGDLYIVCEDELVLGLYAGAGPVTDKLAFALTAEMTPLAVCSSSGMMGHSQSLGRCDLATVVAAEASLADAAATRAANMVKTPYDIAAALEYISAIKGVSGLLLIKDDQVGMAGDLPPLVPGPDSSCCFP